MSYHMSFTSEYIYSNADYRKVREVLEKEAGGKYFDVFPEMQGHGIIAGKVCDTSPFVLDWVIVKLLRGIITDDTIRFVVIGENYSINVLDKMPNGDVRYYVMDNTEIELEDF